MIERYTNPEMGAIWNEPNRYQTWLDVEIAVCEAWAGLGKIPAASLKTIKAKAGFDAERIEAILDTGVPPERLTLVPDCGFSQTARWATRAKLSALVAGRDLVLGHHPDIG